MMESIMAFHRMLKPVKFQCVEAGREKWQVLCDKVVEVTLTAWPLTTHTHTHTQNENHTSPTPSFLFLCEQICIVTISRLFIWRGAAEIQGIHFYIKQLKKYISPFSQVLLLLLFWVFFQVLILNDLRAQDRFRIDLVLCDPHSPLAHPSMPRNYSL